MDDRKALVEYVKEGVMIFVAVTLGFLADSYREYRADRETERSHMRALVADLAVDSMRLAENMLRLEGDIANIDTMVHEFLAGRASGRYAPTIARHAYYGGNSVDLVFNDRTSSQLKGTGAMRLVHDTAVATALLRYWSNQERLREERDRFETLRVEHRKVGWRTFNWYRVSYSRFLPNDSIVQRDTPPPVRDVALMPDFVNTTASLYNMAHNQFLPELRQQQALGAEIRAMLRAAYP